MGRAKEKFITCIDVQMNRQVLWQRSTSSSEKATLYYYLNENSAGNYQKFHWKYRRNNGPNHDLLVPSANSTFLKQNLLRTFSMQFGWFNDSAMTCDSIKHFFCNFCGTDSICQRFSFEILRYVLSKSLCPVGFFIMYDTLLCHGI